jgi:hypothetical protein
MRKFASVSLLAIALLLAPAVPSYAWHGVRTHVFVGVGPAFWWGPPYPYWYYPYPYRYYPYPYWYYPSPYYVYSPPAVVVQEPPVYVQQQPPPAPPPSPQSYWYLCTSAKAYYPNVQTCPEAWIKVPPRLQ